MKSEKELDSARAEFRRAFNFVLGVLRLKGFSGKVALGSALVGLMGGRASVWNAALSFGLNLLTCWTRWGNWRTRGVST